MTIQYSFSSDKSTVVRCFRYFSAFVHRISHTLEHIGPDVSNRPKHNSISVRSAFMPCAFITYWGTNAWSSVVFLFSPSELSIEIRFDPFDTLDFVLPIN